MEDFTDVYFNGLASLDTGEKLDKTIRREKTEKDREGCPACGHKPFARRCMACGFEIQKQSFIETEAGEMQEVMMGKKKLADDKRHLFEQLCSYARENSKPEKQQGRAANLYKDIVGNYPPNNWRFADMPDVPVTRNVLNKITQLRLAFIKGQKNANVQ